MRQVANWISDLIIRYKQRKWRRFLKRNRVYAPDHIIAGPRLRAESGKYRRTSAMSKG